MRKHFLILMLFALLPLAGWAQGAGTGDIRQATVYIEPFGYGGFDLDDVTQENPATITPATGLNIRITDGSGLLTEGVEYTVSNEFYLVNNNDEPVAVSLINDYTQLPVGKYAVKITGINTYNNGHFVYGIFEVKKPILSILFKHEVEPGQDPVDWDEFVKDYGISDPTIAELVQDGLIVKAVVKNSSYMNGDNLIPATEINLEDDQIADLTFTRIANEHANAAYGGDYFTATPAPAHYGYEMTWGGMDETAENLANYNVAYPVTYLKIKQVAITAAQQEAAAVGFHITSEPLEDVTYTGVEQPAHFDITYKNADMFPGTAQKPVDELAETTDYTLSYKYSATGDDNSYEAIEGNPRNAGYYEVYVNGTQTGDYYTAEGVKYGAFQIKKADADVVVIAKTKVYNAQPFTFNTDSEYYLAPEFSISGLVASDEGKVDLTTLTAQAANNVILSKNVGNYSIVANVENAKIVYGTNSQVSLTDNYNVTCLPNNWTITKATLKITAASTDPEHPVAVGTPLTADLSQLTFVGNLENDEAGEPTDADRLEDAFMITLKEGANTNTSGEFADVFIVTRKTAADYADRDEVPETDPVEYTSDDYDAADAILANYDFETEGNITNGTLIVGNLNFTIRPVVPANMQYGTAVNPTYYAYTTIQDHTYVLTADDIDVDNIAYQYSSDGGTTWIATAPKEVNPSYKVKIVAKDNTKPIGKGNYANGNPNTPVVQFAINKKVIDITVHDVLLWEGATKTILQTKGEVDPYVLVDNESINFEYDFVAPEEGDEYAIDENAQTGEKTLSFKEGYDNDAPDATITVVLKDKAGCSNGHYELNVTVGNVLQTNLAQLDLELDGDLTKVVDAINITAANTDLDLKYDVTIKGRKLQKDLWNALVLPFDVEPLAFCNEIDDYAVFNTLTSAENGNVKFSLTRTTIPAHTPFLVKPTKEIDFDKTHTEGGDPEPVVTVRDYVFNAVEIKPFKNGDVDGVPVASVNDAEFIGTYKAINLSEGDGIYVPYKGKFITLAEAKSISHLDAIPLGWTTGYLNVTSGSEARITVEEADGTITAISNITADGVAVAAEGWYTLNGIRLQSVPTEKGVYINNGKKVVIK